MSEMPKSSFVYVTFIQTTVEKLWNALTTQDFMKEYWCGRNFAAEWKVGGAWTLTAADGTLLDTGEIVQLEPQRRIALTWRHERHPDATAEGYGQCVIELEPLSEAVKLSISHSIEIANSRLIELVSGGWPLIVSNLKSLLETGRIAYKA